MEIFVPALKSVQGAESGIKDSAQYHRDTDLRKRCLIIIIQKPFFELRRFAGKLKSQRMQFHLIIHIIPMKRNITFIRLLMLIFPAIFFRVNSYLGRIIIFRFNNSAAVML